MTVIPSYLSFASFASNSCIMVMMCVLGITDEYYNVAVSDFCLKSSHVSPSVEGTIEGIMFIATVSYLLGFSTLKLPSVILMAQK